MKFKMGDIFKVKENGLKGRILSTATTHASFAPVKHGYVIEWEHIPLSQNTYDAQDVDHLWELALNEGWKPVQNSSSPYSINLPPGISINESAITHEKLNPSYRRAGHEISVIVSCDHKFVAYHGLSEYYEYCTICDERKK